MYQSATKLFTDNYKFRQQYYVIERVLANDVCRIHKSVQQPIKREGIILLCLRSQKNAVKRRDKREQIKTTSVRIVVA